MRELAALVKMEEMVEVQLEEDAGCLVEGSDDCVADDEDEDDEEVG